MKPSWSNQSVPLGIFWNCGDNDALSSLLDVNKKHVAWSQVSWNHKRIQAQDEADASWKEERKNRMEMSAGSSLT